MSVRETALIGGTVLVLAIGANQMLSPESPDDARRNHQQQQVENLSDANDNSKQRMRDEGDDHGNAENDRKLQPGEHRPPERYQPGIRIRIP